MSFKVNPVPIDSVTGHFFQNEAILKILPVFYDVMISKILSRQNEYWTGSVVKLNKLLIVIQEVADEYVVKNENYLKKSNP